MISQYDMYVYLKHVQYERYLVDRSMFILRECQEIFDLLDLRTHWEHEQLL